MNLNHSEKPDDISDTELIKLLDHVNLNAFEFDRRVPISSESEEMSLTKQEENPKMIETKESTLCDSKNELHNISSLPISCKLQILSHINHGSLIRYLNPKNEDVNQQTLAPVQLLNKDGRPLFPEHLNFFSVNDLEQLNQEGYLIKDRFLGDHESVVDVNKEAVDLFDKGSFRQSKMSHGKEAWTDNKVRGDSILWLNNRSDYRQHYPFLYNLLCRMDTLRLELNKACDLRSEHTQTHLAVYPGGGSRYFRHLDASSSGSKRRLTMLYYMNYEWKPIDGGQLRMYLPKADHHVAIKDVDPIGDRLLLFQSRTVEHEVLPAFSNRFAMSMWLY